MLAFDTAAGTHHAIEEVIFIFSAVSHSLATKGLSFSKWGSCNGTSAVSPHLFIFFQNPFPFNVLLCQINCCGGRSKLAVSYPSPRIIKNLPTLQSQELLSATISSRHELQAHKEKGLWCFWDGTDAQAAQAVCAFCHPSLGNPARLPQVRGHWTKPSKAPQSLTSKFSEHREVFFAQVLIKTFQSKPGFFISLGNPQHNAGKSNRGQPWHGQISLWTAQPTGANPADQPKSHDQLYYKKHHKGSKRFIWKKPPGDIGSHCAFYKEKKEPSMNAGLDPNLQQDSPGLRSRNTLNCSGKSNLVFKVFPPQQGNSNVLLCDGSQWNRRAEALSLIKATTRWSHPPFTITENYSQNSMKKKRSQGWSLWVEMQHKNRKSRCGAGLGDKPTALDMPGQGDKHTHLGTPGWGTNPHTWTLGQTHTPGHPWT